MKRPSPQETQWADGAIFTVGHSTLPIERFIEMLETYGIQCVADIRTVPRSRHNPQFNEDALQQALGAHGIEYVALRTLGELKDNSALPALQKNLDSKEAFVAEYAQRAIAQIEGKPHRIDDGSCNLGLAVDVEKRDGSRTLMVPVIRESTPSGLIGFGAPPIASCTQRRSPFVPDALPISSILWPSGKK